MKRINFIIVFISVFGTIVSAQTSKSLKQLLGDGIFIQGGFGYLALRDEYISNEKYSGYLPYFETGWLKSQDSSAVRYSIIFRNSTDIKNSNLSAKVVEGGLNMDYIYPIGSFKLFTRDVFAFLGHSIEIFYYDRSENIAGSGYQSYATSYTLGINSTLIHPIGSNFYAECSGKLDLIGWGQRSVTSLKQTKFISIFSGINGYTNILFRYNFSESLMLKAGYRFEICQSSTWDYLLSVSDNLIFVLAYRI